jgi:general secretion pathway protein F
LHFVGRRFAVASWTSQPTTAISLDELVALNDEIAALVRAGVPLESGLVGLGADLPGRLGRIVASLGQRMSRGQSLVQALAEERPQIPRLYAAVVEAGVRSGRLAAALEGLAVTARQMIELRALAGAALIYPLIVLGLAYLLWIGFVLWVAPVVEPGYRSFEAPSADWIQRFAETGATIRYWGPVLPLAVFGALGLWWRRSGRAATVESKAAGRSFGWIPGAGQLLVWSQAATFADVLALLIDQQVPLDQAVVLAAEASGSRALAAEAERLATAVRQGAPLGDCLGAAPGFPPFLAWLIQTGQERGILSQVLRHAAETYRERARQSADATRLLLPMLLTVGIAGGTVVVYALLIFWPWISLLKSLSKS